MSKKEQITAVIINAAKTEMIEDKVLARCIGTMLYDIPFTKSGYISKSCVDEDGYRPSYSKMVAEHFHSRQYAGETIVKLVKKGHCIKSFIDKCTTVHYTTKDENLRLSQIQNHESTKHLSWKEQYKLAGIVLVKDIGMKRKKVKKS